MNKQDNRIFFFGLFGLKCEIKRITTEKMELPLTEKGKTEGGKTQSTNLAT